MPSPSSHWHKAGNLPQFDEEVAYKKTDDTPKKVFNKVEKSNWEAADNDQLYNCSWDLSFRKTCSTRMG